MLPNPRPQIVGGRGLDCNQNSIHCALSSMLLYLDIPWVVVLQTHQSVLNGLRLHGHRIIAMHFPGAVEQPLHSRGRRRPTMKLPPHFDDSGEQMAICVIPLHDVGRLGKMIEKNASSLQLER